MLPPALTDGRREGAKRGSLQREGELGLPPPRDKQAAGQGGDGSCKTPATPTPAPTLAPCLDLLLSQVLIQKTSLNKHLAFYILS